MRKRIGLCSESMYTHNRKNSDETEQAQQIQKLPMAPLSHQPVETEQDCW